MRTSAGASRLHPRLFKTFAGTVEVRSVPWKARAHLSDGQARIVAHEGIERATTFVGASRQNVSGGEETIGPGACRIFCLRALVPTDRFIITPVLEIG